MSWVGVIWIAVGGSGGCKVNGGVGLGWGERNKPWCFSVVDEEGLGHKVFGCQGAKIGLFLAPWPPNSNYNGAGS